MTGVTVSVWSSPSRRSTTVTGRSPLNFRKPPIHPMVPVTGTGSPLNESNSSLLTMPALSAGEPSTTEITVARTHRRPKASAV